MRRGLAGTGGLAAGARPLCAPPAGWGSPALAHARPCRWLMAGWRCHRLQAALRCTPSHVRALPSCCSADAAMIDWQSHPTTHLGVSHCAGWCVEGVEGEPDRKRALRALAAAHGRSRRHATSPASQAPTAGLWRPAPRSRQSMHAMGVQRRSGEPALGPTCGMAAVAATRACGFQCLQLQHAASRGPPQSSSLSLSTTCRRCLAAGCCCCLAAAARSSPPPPSAPLPPPPSSSSSSTIKSCRG